MIKNELCKIESNLSDVAMRPKRYFNHIVIAALVNSRVVLYDKIIAILPVVNFMAHS